MATKTLYGVLGLPPSASGLEIRAAYQCLIARVSNGEIAPAQGQEIEAAYATLGNPVQRVHYDIQLTAPPLPVARQDSESTHAMLQSPIRCLRHATVLATPPRFRFPNRWVTLPRRRPAIAIRVLATTFALLASVGIVVLLLPRFRGPHGSLRPTQMVASRVGTPAPATPPEDMEDAPSQPLPPSPQEPASVSPAANTALLRVPEVASVQWVAPRLAPAGTFFQAATGPETVYEPDLPSGRSIAEIAPSSGPTIAALEQFLPGGSRAANQRTLSVTGRAGRVTGQYCQDLTGGEIFVPGGAPVPGSLACPG